MTYSDAQSSSQQPRVSVIIPVYNDIVRLERCLGALAAQTYPNYEVIVVDNGSSDGDVAEVCRAFPEVRFSREPRVGSYAARNRGVRLAQGDLFAFTDSDCVPAADWVEEGAARLQAGCGVVAGHIDVFPRDRSRPSLVELYDMMLAFPQERYVKNNRYGVTANLLTTRAVFDAVGTFDDTLKSGGDHEWGHRASAGGFSLAYAPEVRVAHPARKSLGELRKKARRVVGGGRDSRSTSDMMHWLRIALYPPVGTSRRVFGDESRGLSPLQKVKVCVVETLWRWMIVKEIVRSVLFRQPSTRS